MLDVATKTCYKEDTAFNYDRSLSMSLCVKIVQNSDNWLSAPPTSNSKDMVCGSHLGRCGLAFEWRTADEP